MATQIRISTGGLSAERNYSDDTGAQRTLLLFARRIGVPDSATNQQRMQAIVDWCVGRIQDGAKQQQFDDQRSALEEQIAEENKLK